jgi:hypothetical protein
MEHLVAPTAFDPVREKSHFHISGPDNVCTVVLPPLCRQYANGRYQVYFEFHPWQSGITELGERGRVAPFQLVGDPYGSGPALNSILRVACDTSSEPSRIPTKVHFRKEPKKLRAFVTSRTFVMQTSINPRSFINSRLEP